MQAQMSNKAKEMLQRAAEAETSLLKESYLRMAQQYERLAQSYQPLFLANAPSELRE